MQEIWSRMPGSPTNRGRREHNLLYLVCAGDVAASRLGVAIALGGVAPAG